MVGVTPLVLAPGVAAPTTVPLPPTTPGVALPRGRDVAAATVARVGTVVGRAAAAGCAVARAVGCAVACSPRPAGGFGVATRTRGVASDTEGSALRGSLTVRAAKTATPTAIRSAMP